MDKKATKKSRSKKKETEKSSEKSAAKKVKDKGNKGTAKMKSDDKIKRLYKSQDDKYIAGVCGGIAEYFSIDPVWVRLIAILLIFVQGIGIILYIVAWILIPKNPNQKLTQSKIEEEVEEQMDKIEKSVKKKSEKKGLMVIGMILIALGVFFLLEQFLPWLTFSFIWPLAIIAVGVYLITKNSK